MWWWIALGIVALFAVGLTLSVVFDWFRQNKTVSSDYGELIKERLANGNYRVVAGVFEKRLIRRDIMTASQAWETEDLDEDLKEYFGNRNRVKVEI